MMHEQHSSPEAVGRTVHISPNFSLAKAMSCMGSSAHRSDRSRTSQFTMVRSRMQRPCVESLKLYNLTRFIILLDRAMSAAVLKFRKRVAKKLRWQRCG